MLKFVISVLFLSIFINAQDKKEDIAATAGDIEISRSEFQERFQLNPQISIHRRAQGEANKKLFLYGLIAEKLLSLEANEYGLDTSATVRYYLKNFEKMFVRDELYRRAVSVKSSEYAENLLSFYLNNASRIFTKTIISKDKDKIRNIYNILTQGLPFDSVFTELTPQEKDTITLYSGTLDEKTEKELFALPEKHFSKPLQYNEHWVIFFIENKSNPVMAKSMGWESEYKRLERISKEKAEAVFYKQYMENFFADKKVEAKGFLIKSLSEKINQLVNEKVLDDTGSYFLSSEDIVKLGTSYSADTLNSEFVIIKPDTLPFNDYLLWLRTEVFEVKENSYERIAALVSAKVKKYIEYELLTREGYRLNLEKSENVKKMYSMWRDNYLYQLQVSFLSDSLLRENVEADLVKLAGFSSSDLDQIEKIINEYEDGKDFLALISEYSTDPTDTSYRYISSLYEIEDEVVQANTGDVVGPVKSGNGYIIFKVLDKKSSGRARGLIFSQTGETINPFDKHIASLASKYVVTINEDIISEIKDSNINAVIFKYLGFGGRLSAVPILNPISGWYQEWQKEVKLNP